MILDYGSNLSYANGETVIQPAIILMITQVKSGCHDLATTRWIRSSIPRVVEVNDGSIAGFDDTLEFGLIGAVSSSARMISALKLTLDPSFASTFGYIEMLAFSTGGRGQRHFSAMWVGKPNAIQG
jgi:hypothetical protein